MIESWPRIKRLNGTLPELFAGLQQHMICSDGYSPHYLMFGRQPHLTVDFSSLLLVLVQDAIESLPM